MNKRNWKKYGFEFLSIFIAVISAFALNNWNENRKENNAQDKIIIEIANGLEKDLEDIRINKAGHESGVMACKFWRKVINNNEVNLDTMIQHYFSLTRDYISIQNVSGYQTLKSQGLELIKNDSLRFAIISLYEYDYNTLRKFEEEYHEMQFQENFFKEINGLLAPHFIFDQKGNMAKIDLPLKLSEEEKKLFLTYLWKIQVNRQFILGFYLDVENKVEQLLEFIRHESRL